MSSSELLLYFKIIDRDLFIKSLLKSGNYVEFGAKLNSSIEHNFKPDFFIKGYQGPQKSDFTRDVSSLNKVFKKPLEDGSYKIGRAAMNSCLYHFFLRRKNDDVSEKQFTRDFKDFSISFCRLQKGGKNRYEEHVRSFQRLVIRLPEYFEKYKNVSIEIDGNLNFKVDLTTNSLNEKASLEEDKTGLSSEQEQLLIEIKKIINQQSKELIGKVLDYLQIDFSDKESKKELEDRLKSSKQLSSFKSATEFQTRLIKLETKQEPSSNLWLNRYMRYWKIVAVVLFLVLVTIVLSVIFLQNKGSEDPSEESEIPPEKSEQLLEVDEDKQKLLHADFKIIVLPFELQRFDEETGGTLGIAENISKRLNRMADSLQYSLYADYWDDYVPDDIDEAEAKRILISERVDQVIYGYYDKLELREKVVDNIDIAYVLSKPKSYGFAEWDTTGFFQTSARQLIYNGVIENSSVDEIILLNEFIFLDDRFRRLYAGFIRPVNVLEDTLFLQQREQIMTRIDRLVDLIDESNSQFTYYAGSFNLYMMNQFTRYLYHFRKDYSKVSVEHQKLILKHDSDAKKYLTKSIVNSSRSSREYVEAHHDLINLSMLLSLNPEQGLANNNSRLDKLVLAKYGPDCFYYLFRLLAYDVYWRMSIKREPNFEYAGEELIDALAEMLGNCDSMNPKALLDTYLICGAFYRKIGRSDKCIVLIEKGLSEFPNNLLLKLLLLHSYLDKKNDFEGPRLLASLESEIHSDDYLYNSYDMYIESEYIIILYRLKDYENARKRLEFCHLNFPQDDYYWKVLNHYYLLGAVLD